VIGPLAIFFASAALAQDAPPQSPSNPLGVTLPDYLQPAAAAPNPAAGGPQMVLPPVQPTPPYPVGAQPMNLFGNYCATCNQEPRQGLVIFNDVDSWHGIADRGNRSNRISTNDGGSFGFNYATRLGRISDVTGIGFQVGGSYGVYDWDGRPFNPGTLNVVSAQQQVFITTGFFKRADTLSPWSYGIVHDWMINQAFGAYAVNPTLGQWRGQLAYAASASNEFGAWIALRDKGSTNLDAFGNSIVTRPIDQSNFFWHHKWELGADSWIWIGIPEGDSVNHFIGGNVGTLTLGGSVIAPLNDYVSVYSNVQYMHPNAVPGPFANSEAAWNVAFGLQYTVGGHARTSTVAGNCWMPLMPVANNGNFLVDAARFFNP
jgi:hypothetical protein